MRCNPNPVRDYVPIHPKQEEAPHAPAMSEIQNEIACKALDLLMLLLAREGGDGGGGDGDGKRPERQTLVADVEDGMLSEMLAHVAFSRADAFSHAPPAIRERAMRVAGALVAGHPTIQYNMGEASLSVCLVCRNRREATVYWCMESAHTGRTAG